MNYEYIKDSGLIVPDTEDIKTTVENEFKAAFGDDLVTGGNTPQGLLINGETLARDTFIRNNAALANQINPNYAGGVFLDAIGALTNTERDEEQFSTVTMEYHGAPFTAFSTSVIVEDGQGNQFSPVSDGVIASTGVTTGTAKALLPGPIKADIDTITIIKNGVIGLETVKNTTEATLGAFEQNDEQFRVKRRQTIGKLGTGNILQIISSVRALPNVKSAELVENYTSEVEIIDDITMQPHSIYVCVDGGVDEDIAEILVQKKSPGCGFTNGASGDPVSVSYTNPTTGQVFTVLFDRPDLKIILVKVTVSIPNIAIDAVTIIKEALEDYANGSLDGEDGLKIGVEVTPYELAGAINLRNTGIFVRNVELTISGGLYAKDNIPIKKYERATINKDSVTVVIV